METAAGPIDVRLQGTYNEAVMGTMSTDRKMKMLRLTCLIRREGDQYASLCLELDVASCGRTREEAFRALQDAVEAYVTHLVAEGREQEILRPVPPEAIREFLLGEGEEEGEVEERRLITVYAAPLEFAYAA